MIDILKELQKKIDKRQILVNEPMSKHTSFKIGGEADFFVKVTSTEELKFVLEFSQKNKIPITIIGNGTNILVRDKGIRGIVVKVELNDFKIKRSQGKALIVVGAGFPVRKDSPSSIKRRINWSRIFSWYTRNYWRWNKNECGCLWKRNEGPSCKHKIHGKRRKN